MRFEENHFMKSQSTLKSFNELSLGEALEPQPYLPPANSMRAGSVGNQRQTFSITAPAAASVQLVGCFTNWQQQPINLRKGTDGVWRASVRLQPGTYYYRYLVDGEWSDDPDCPLVVPNPFGCLNAVRQVH